LNAGCSKTNALAICHAIKEGQSLRKACFALNLDPTQFHRRLAKSPELCLEYAHAREEQADKFADEIVELSDAATVRDAHVARLRVDSRKWVAAKLLPKKYGDRPAEVNVNTQINLAVITPEDQARLQARRLELLREGA
jgi:hypothetical protein